ncbi:hypothetical protein BDB01DRAFT_832888 [Pilobolus umbonatus]|nr:hypothetical protein BDB01DRAFT_832888 [Pilobolus umbonatus]
MSGNNIKVVVRCRPLNSREKARGAHCLIRMEGNKTIITKPTAPGGKAEEPKAFTFDQSYWSFDKEDPDYADQEKVYNDLGRELLDHAFSGYNCCIFAYGQTGSGKSYSMMGYGAEKGIIPKTCLELFDRIEERKTPTLDFQVEVSFIEIYNEKVRDLLNPRNKGNLKVREHPVLGPYVQDLSRLAVDSFENIDQLMDEGNKARTVAATNMNETSSRSHSVFTIFVTQRILDPATKQVAEKVARISLVDLAGSERANSTGATGVRLKEGANINKSLTTLGKVIAGLAEQASGEQKKNSKKSKETHVPFRDSVLTWLLKDSLGGNSKTCMIAAISPADYDETMSTLRYADQAKRIKTKAVVNEDANAKMMRELKEEVEALRQALMVYSPEEVEKITAITHAPKGKRVAPLVAPTAKIVTPISSKSTVVFTDASGNTTQLTKDEMVEQLQMTEKLITNLNQTWEEKLITTEKIHVDRENTLKKLGISIEKNEVGVYISKEIPYLINLNEDPLMSECLIYHIKPGVTHVDKVEDPVSVECPENTETDKNKGGIIRLSGANISEKHCYFENVEDSVTLYPRTDCTTMVNGRRISEPRKLKSGYRIILGDHHVFRFNNPAEALKERDSLAINSVQANISPLDKDGADFSSPPSPISDKDCLFSPFPGSDVVDWNFARREAMLNTYINDSNFEKFTDEDLDKLFDDVAKVRIVRKRKSNSSESLSRRTSSSSVRRSTYSTTASSIFLDDSSDSYYTTDTSTTSSTASFTREELLMMAKEDKDVQLEYHRKKYESKLRKLSRRFSYPPSPILFTPTEAALGLKVYNVWKRKRNVTMAQTILRNIEYVRQANEMAQKAGKNASYQFVVVDDNLSVNALSHWDITSSASNFSKATVDPTLAKENKPCIGIQVIDKKNNSLYLWSVEKFLARVRYIKGAYFASDSKKYIKGDDLYFDNVAPAHTLVGLAKVQLKNLDTQVPMESSLSVYCHNTGRKMGNLKVLIAPIARSVRHPYRSPSSSQIDGEDNALSVYDDDNPRNLLSVGQQLVFEVCITEFVGLDPKEFSRVHAQFRLSNFGSNLEGIFASNPVDYKVKAPIMFNYHQTLSMAITEDLLNTIKHKDIVFEVYGQPTREYLNKLSLNCLSYKSFNPSQMIPIKKSQDVLARIQLCEITAGGEYKPVPVESVSTDNLLLNTFSLQQGQQRRILLSIEHGAENKDIELEKITEMKIGQVRLMDNKNRITESPSQADIPLKIIVSSSTPGQLCAHGSWDSSLHDSLLLNTITPNTHKVVLSLSWTVRNKSQHSIKFEKDIYVHIKDQTKAASIKKKSTTTKRASVILNFFSGKSNHFKSQITCPFIVNYTPEVFGVHDLGNQELPSKILNTYHSARALRIKREQVEQLQYTVYLTEQLDRLFSPDMPKDKSSTKPFKRMTTEEIINIWRKPMEDAKPIAIDSKPTVHRWLPEVQQVLINDSCTSKTGFLTRKDDINGEHWSKVWCKLKGNYLFVYDDQYEVNEIDVIHIKKVHKEDNEVNNTLKVKNVFTIDTQYDSHVFQAQDIESRKEWVNTMDYLSSLY